MAKKRVNSKNKKRNNNNINNKNKKISYLFIRYILLLLLMFSLPLIYKIFYKPTFYSVVLIMKLFSKELLYDVTLGTISIDKIVSIEIIPACIAGSAYLLLLILNLSVDMKLQKRIYTILLSFFLFFIINVTRIIVLSLLYLNNTDIFYFVHIITWYAISIVLVVLIWFFIVKIFSIKEIPFYSDIKLLKINK